MRDSEQLKKYNELMSSLQEMHRQNIKKTSTALKSLLIVPTLFLILLFLTNSSKTVFLVLWIASLFIISAILIIIEYQDYNLKKMISSVAAEESSEASEEAEATVEAEEEVEATAETEAEVEADADETETENSEVTANS